MDLCRSCGGDLGTPASRVVYDYRDVHWRCLSRSEKADLRAIEAEARSFAAEIEATDRSFARCLAAEDVRFLHERERLGT